MSLNHPGQHEENFAAMRVMQLSSANRAENSFLMIELSQGS